MDFYFWTVLWLVMGVCALADAGIVVHEWEKGNRGEAVFFSVVAVALFLMSGAFAVIGMFHRMTVDNGSGDYYEVLIATPAIGGGTLVQARDINDAKVKTAVLAEFPPNGYKVEKERGRTFLLPADVRVTEKAGEYIIASPDGDAFIYAPPVDGPSGGGMGIGG